MKVLCLLDPSTTSPPTLCGLSRSLYYVQCSDRPDSGAIPESVVSALEASPQRRPLKALNFEMFYKMYKYEKNVEKRKYVRQVTPTRKTIRFHVQRKRQHNMQFKEEADQKSCLLARNVAAVLVKI